MISRDQLIDKGACPLCGGAKSTEHIGFKDIPVLQCSNCGFLYSGKLIPPDLLECYYREGFGSERHRQGQVINAQVNAWAIQRLIPMLDKLRMLDVGTGYGYLLKHLTDAYYVDAVGVELSQQEAAYGARNLGVTIKNCMLADAGLPLESFDLVTSFEVIEHIPDPGQFIKELLSYVKPGGHLLVMTDNFTSQVARDLGPAFPKWIPHSHISHFGSSTFEKLFQKDDLKIVGRLSYTPWELLARKIYYDVRNYRPSASECFKLDEVLVTEMHGTYKFFQFRQLANRVWARLTASNNLDGALMYVLAKRIA